LFLAEGDGNGERGVCWHGMVVTAEALDWRGLCFIQIAAEAWRCVEQ